MKKVSHTLPIAIGTDDSPFVFCSTAVANIIE